jgi:hypothetical protein
MVDRAGPVEIDVATLREHQADSAADGGTLVATWAPPAPSLVLPVEMPSDDAVEVQVFSEEGDPRLAAAIELASPRNKDRPQAREAFAIKCASYLQQGCGLVVIDTVTTRRADLNAALLSLLGSEAALGVPSLSAVSYLPASRGDESQELRVWPSALELGSPLPTLPLWIASKFSVPLDLQASYQATCEDICIRDAG